MAAQTAETELADLLASIRRCRICAEVLEHEPRPVLRAAASARVVIAGQAPGRLVHETGVPWNDPSGDRLRQWLDLDRETFYDETRIAIVPQGFCFPGTDPKGGDYPPRPECAAEWHDRLMPMLPKVEFTLCIGQYAQRWHLGGRRQKSMTETVRNWRRFMPRYLPLPHPSWRNTGWLKRNPWFEADVLPALQARIRVLI